MVPHNPLPLFSAFPPPLKFNIPKYYTTTGVCKVWGGSIGNSAGCIRSVLQSHHSVQCLCRAAAQDALTLEQEKQNRHAQRLNDTLFVLTTATTLFAPVQFLAGPALKPDIVVIKTIVIIAII